MRQRKAKDLDKRLQECSEYMIAEPKTGKLQDCFENSGELFLEIGCGKGSFIIKKALENPQENFIAIEGQDTVILRALEKVKATVQKGQRAGTGAQVRGAALCNLKFMLTFVDTMDEFFEENQLAGIYLNFSDPWPKARHAKRRLTYRKRLEDYKWALKPGGFIEIKTDNDSLYAFTLEEIAAAGLNIAEQTEDLHNSDFDSQNTTTEYEEKFKSSGKTINYVKVTV